MKKRGLLQGGWVLVVCLSFLLVSCGAGGDAGTTEGGIVAPSSIDLLVSSPQLGSDGVSTVTLTALVKGNGNVAMADQKVSFSADSGVITVTRDTTDASGTAEATLGTGGDKSNRTITVTAKTGAISSTNTVSVTGTTVSISGQNSLVLGASTELTVFLKDSAGNGIANEQISLASSRDNNLSPATVTTNANGQAKVVVTASVGGTDTITATALGASAVHSLEVSTTEFTFTTPAPGAEVNIGASQPVTVHYAIGGVAQSGVTVNFTTTRGTIDNAATTDVNGNATVNVSATTAGPALLTAFVSGGPSVQVSIEFVATVANSMTIQADPAVIGTQEQSTITVSVRDDNGNLVKNKKISFALTDNSGGSISPATAITNSYGEASTVYTAGATSSGLDGVRIDASVVGATVTASTTLTVAKKSLFISLGTGNKIIDLDDTRYQKDYSVLVVDAAGNPMAGVSVTASVAPLSYTKGYYQWNEDASKWVRQITLVPPDFPSCRNEDMVYDPGTSQYLNGILDLGEDINNDDRLTPGTVVSVTPITTTDATGFGKLSLIYAKQYASWVEVKLEVRASVAGSEAVAVATFDLPGLASDYTNEDVSPPGNPSPFGTSTTCSE